MAAQARHVDQWVTEGIISRDQARSICEYERQVAPSRVTAFEAIAYAGSAMAAGVAFAMVLGAWQQLTRAARVGVTSFTAASLMAVGIMAVDDSAPPVRRFGEAALLLAVPTIALTTGITVGAGVGVTTSILIGSGVAWAVAVPLYATWRTGPQNVALFCATLSFVLSLVMYPFEPVPGALPGAVVLAVGAGWVAASVTERMRPRLTSEISGSAAALIGSMMILMGFTTGLAAALAIAVALSGGIVTFGVARSRITLTVVGLVAMGTYVPWLASEIFGSSIAGPFTMVATAMALALWATRKSKRT